MRSTLRARFALILLTVIIGVTILPTASFASSAAGEHEKCIADIEHKIVNKEINDTEAEALTEDCFSAPSPILPATNEIIWGSIAFLVVLAGLMKFGFPAVQKGLADRENKIRTDLESAEQSRQDAADKAAEYDAKLADARVEAQNIIDEAKAAQIREKANKDALSTQSRAMEDIQSQVAELSVDLAEKLVKQNLDKKSQLALVETYIAELSKN